MGRFLAWEGVLGVVVGGGGSYGGSLRILGWGGGGFLQDSYC